MSLDDSCDRTPRIAELERWLVRQPLAGLRTAGETDGFVDEVLNRLDLHGPDVLLGRTADAILVEVEEEALDAVAWLLLLAYLEDTGIGTHHADRLFNIVQSAAAIYFSARNIRLGRAGR